jgi:DNA (cytosine-5)-methyltransferase 1
MTLNKVQKTTFIDLFAGIGGFHFALDSLGFECVFASEIDEKARITYEANFKDISPKLFEGIGLPLFNKDITKIDPKDIPDHDILCGGFPCQPFSIAGHRKGFEDVGRGDLIFNIVDIIRVKQPRVVFLENVKNLYSQDQGQTYRYIKELIQKQGYFVKEKVLNASNFGLPTARERLYILAFKNKLDFDQFEFPEGSKKPVKLLDFLENENTQTQKYEIIRDDITLKNIEIKPDIFGNFPQKTIQIGKINKGGQGERIYSPFGHAITLSAHGGGAAAKTGAYSINGKIRKLTPRECARIMGFGENFKILVSDSEAYKQFGNSVATAVIKAITQNIYNILEPKNLCQTQNTQQILAQQLLEMAF